MGGIRRGRVGKGGDNQKTLGGGKEGGGAPRENRLRGGFIQKKKRLGKKKEERIHAWISNFTAEHLEEIAGLGKKKKKKKMRSSFLF